MTTTGEPVITLDLDTVTEPISGPSTRPAVHQFKSRGKGVKCTGTFTSSNMARTYGEMEEEEEFSFEYPAYLYQEPPSKLKVEDLRKHALIAQIKKDTSVYNFLEMAKGVIGPMKNAFLTAAGHTVPDERAGGDHCYQAANPNES